MHCHPHWNEVAITAVDASKSRAEGRRDGFNIQDWSSTTQHEADMVAFKLFCSFLSFS